jgi:S-DNA-T family DNA segregation ATPase FtsK/SpoIIIE
VKNEKSKDDFKVFEKTSEVSDYRYPPLSLLNSNKTNSINDKEYRVAAINRAKKLEEILQSFGVDAKVVNICRGPSVTRFELQPKAGIKVSKIVNLADDISLGMATSGVRIEAPIPGKAAIGVEIPNKKVSPVVVKDVIGSSVFKTAKSSISFAMGFDISGDTIIADIAKMPHLLIAGATGAGKSVCINCLITSILYKSSPDEVKVLMIDPKVVELGVYNGIPHLLIPVVTDPKKAAAALNWAVTEMEDRYTKFAELGVRNIETYNKAIKKKYEISMEQEKGKKDKAENEQAPDFMPKIVIIIDELSDLMMVAPNDVEDAICRLAQMARAAGMHLVIATQRPSVNVITGVIKANIPTRISFAVSSQIDSRTILDMAGAEKLLGKGDMLYLPVGRQKPIRLQGAFISESEVENIVEYVKDKKAPDYDEDIIEEINSDKAEHGHGVKEEEWDEVLPKAVELVIDMGQASVSLIQRKFKVGYARAARIIDQMEDRGIVGSFEGSKPRNVLISKQEWQEMQTSSREV